MAEYEIKDINLAEQGRRWIEYSTKEMPVLSRLRQRFQKEKPLQGLKIGLALHITSETAYLVEVLAAGGAETAICASNPLSTQDECTAYLAANGYRVYAYKGETKHEYYEFIKRVIQFKPHITVDDGCDLITTIHSQYPELLNQIIGGTEETTTGVNRLKVMEKQGKLKYPVIAVNDNFTKHMFDNYYGTGQSAIDGIIRVSNILFAGKKVVVVGYGDCGKGVALRAKGLGANVIVTEVDAKRALQAVMDGYQVMPIREAAKIGDIFIAVTGNKHVIPFQTIKQMKDGAILANAGHFDNEIDVAALEKHTEEKSEVRQYFKRYRINNKDIYLCGEGRLVNLVCADGHPSSVLDLSFAGQALAVEFLAKNRGKLKPQVLNLPEELDNQIAKLKLESMGINIDELTDEQLGYLSSWQEGT